MDDTERLREIAASIIKDSNDEGRIKSAADLLKLASEIENQRAEANKFAAEKQKISLDLGESQSRRKSDERKTYITLLAPVFTTLVLAGTLILQSYQFVQSERDKHIENNQQANAAEDVRWTDAVKLLSQSNNLSPAGVLLKSFVNSPRYGAQARQTAVQILLKTDDPELFDNLFVSAYEPIDWNDLPEVIDLNRELYANIGPVLQKSFDTKSRVNDTSKLSPLERKQYDSFVKEIGFTGVQMGPVLRGPRPTGAVLDLHSTDIAQCDLQGADLRGANLNGANMTLVNLNGAKLSGISYQGLSLYQTAWWEASEISEDALQYAMRQYPLRPGDSFGPSYRTISKKDYDDSVARLRSALSH